MARNIEDSLLTRLQKCQFYSFALYESTDISDTAQLPVFIRGITENDVVELLDLCPMKGTTTRKDIFNQFKQVMRKCKISEEKICSFTTDEASTITGKHNGFVTLMIVIITPGHPLSLHHSSATTVC